MKKKLMVRLLPILSILLLFGCEGSREPVSHESDNNGPEIIKQANLRSYLESTITTIAKEPNTFNPDFLERLSKESILLNQVPGLDHLNPYLVVEETGLKYRIVVSRFAGSRGAASTKVVFALDPDRFFPNQPVSGFKATLDNIGLQKQVALRPEIIENIMPTMIIDYPLVFVDIEQMVGLKESDGPPDVRSALCMECEEGGGGGGGNPPAPKPWLVLRYIELKYDHDSGDDEFELYWRKDASINQIPGQPFHGRTPLIFSGDVRPDGAGRYVWFPNLNNAGDFFGGLDIVIGELSDDYSLSFIGAEDDDLEGRFDYGSGPTPLDIMQANEYRHDAQNSYTWTMRKINTLPAEWFDNDEWFDKSHFGIFTASNLVEGEEITLELEHLKVIVVKRTF